MLIRANLFAPLECPDCKDLSLTGEAKFFLTGVDIGVRLFHRMVDDKITDNSCDSENSMKAQ